MNQNEQTPPPRHSNVHVVWFVLAAALAIGAVFAYAAAQNAVKLDNPYMAGDQSAAANNATAILLAVVAGVALIVGAIFSSKQDRYRNAVARYRGAVHVQASEGDYGREVDA